jgi:hypothetical protein
VEVEGVGSTAGVDAARGDGALRERDCGRR